MKRRKWLLRSVLLVVAVVLVAVAVPAARFGLFYYFYVHPTGRPGPVMISVEEGANAGSIARLLEREGVVRSASNFLRVVRYFGREKDLQAGEYRFDLPIAPRTVLGVLKRNSPDVLAVTVPEGLTIDETAAVFGEAGAGPPAAFAKVFRDPAPVRALDPSAATLEGYLFPGTYRVSPNVAPERAACALVRAFQRRFAQPEAEAIARARRPLHDIVTLASLVEKETAQPAERAHVAGVFLARLASGMRLQCDPTVIYAARRSGAFTGTIRRPDLERDDPYNTYVRPGLPPGPIASPGLASLRAALEPTRGLDLYFVAKGDGSHVFSSTLDAHNRNVRRYRGQ